MSWKKFKKDNVFLDYTIMVLPHSQRKAIHFKLPVWVFGMAVLFLTMLVGGVLFFAGSSYQLRQVAREKEQLQREWEQISVQKQQIEEENADLKIAREEQEKELKELERKTSDTITELEKLTAREKEIRSQLGLESKEESTDESLSLNDGRSDREADPDIMKKKLDLLTSAMEEQAVLYDDLTVRIPEYKQGERRKQIVDYALEFVGNQYRYGGNNPNSGVDCSGFSRYVMSHAAGVYLSRSAASQSSEGHEVTREEAKPGDLIFYGGSNYIDHVAIYMGNGKVVHASNERVGITVSGWDYRKPVKIMNVLGD